MLNINLRAVLSRMVAGPLVILASLLLVAVAVACSDGTPTEAPGASLPPPETAVASPATPEPPRHYSSRYRCVTTHRDDRTADSHLTGCHACSCGYALTRTGCHGHR